MGPAETRGKDGPAPPPSRPSLPASLAGQPQWEGSAPWHLSRLGRGLWRRSRRGAPFLTRRRAAAIWSSISPTARRRSRCCRAATRGSPQLLLMLPALRFVSFSFRLRLTRSVTDSPERGTPFPGHSKERVPVPSHAPSASVLFRPVSSGFVQFRLFSSLFVRFRPVSSGFVRFRLFSSGFDEFGTGNGELRSLATRRTGEFTSPRL